MSDSNSSHDDSQSNEVLDELRNLGNNLKELLQSVWGSEERKKLQGEIEMGIQEIADSLSKAATEFSQTQTGQTLKSDIQDLNQRIQTGQLEAKIRIELLSVLQKANEGLKKATSQHKSGDTPEESPKK